MTTGGAGGTAGALCAAADWAFGATAQPQEGAGAGAVVRPVRNWSTTEAITLRKGAAEDAGGSGATATGVVATGETE